MWTPWGRADHIEQITDGVVRVATPSHGGMFCDEQTNAAVPEALRNANGWYEEDCEANIVVVSFPEHFTPAQVTAARAAICEWFPDRYEAWTGIAATAETSHIVAAAEFHATHAEHFVTVAAWGSWNDAVPEGFVGVAATLGGDRGGAKAYFLVPADEYEQRGRHGFVVDPACHTQVDAIS